MTEEVATSLGAPSASVVFRAPMRSRRQDVPEGAAVERALAQSSCGIGGVFDRAPRDLSDALQLAADQHDERLARRIGRFADAVEGSLVWTRDADGLFWLGRLEGPWRYDSSPEAVAVDLVHVRRCRWLSAPTPEHLAPAAVGATFARGGRNWQRIHAAGAYERSAQVWDAAMPSAR
jgi:hypothetical protein